MRWLERRRAWIQEGRDLQIQSEQTRREIAVLLARANDRILETGHGAYHHGLERAAEIADEMAEGVANPEKPYNEAFIHACGVIARAIREAK